MKNIITIFLVLFSCFAGKAQIPDNYSINGYPVSRNVIEAYLTRAMTMSCLLDHDDGNYYKYGFAPFGPNNINLLQNNPDIQKNFQLIHELRPKYLHRADGRWGGDLIYTPQFNMFVPYWDNVEWMANEVHSIDPDIIIEAGLFEAVDAWNINASNIQDLHDPLITIDPNDPATAYIYNYWPELNNQPFTVTRYNMLYIEEQIATNAGIILKDKWYVPDMSQLATRIWWFYRACEYVRRGYESIHMGRVDIMLKRDNNNRLLGQLLDRIRAFGSTPNPSVPGESTYARRGVVLFNSCHTIEEARVPHHSGTYSFAPQFTISSSSFDHVDRYVKKEFVYRDNPADQKLLWDWGSSAITIEEDIQSPSLTHISQITQASILAMGDPGMAGHDMEPSYGRSAGGIHPQGWICDHLPYYVEWDCTNGFDLPWAPYQFVSWNKIYGMDERTWFMSIETPDARAEWLQYAYERVRCLDKNAFLMMPGMWQGYFRYDAAAAKFNKMYYRASDPTFNVSWKIAQLWDGNNGNHHPDRNERFVCVNRRDGTLWNTQPQYPAFYFGEKGFTGDFNRDGRDDLLSIPNNDPGVGVQWPDAHRVYETKPSGDDFDYLGTVNVPHPCGPWPYFSWGENVYVGDFDGDGFRDEVAVVPNKSLGITCPGGVTIFKATRAWNASLGRFSFSGFQFKLNIPFPSYTEKLHIGDFNGDGKDDIFCIADNSPAVGSNWQGFKILLSTSTTSAHSFAPVLSYPSGMIPFPTSWGEDFYIGDFNGDGLDDFFVVANKALGISWQGMHLYINQLSWGSPSFTYVGDMSCSSWGCFPSWGEEFYVGDYDGNGLDDVIFKADKHVGISWHGYHAYMNKYNSGSYWFEDKGTDGCTQCCYPSWGERFNIGDFNGDGRSDFLVSSDATLGIGNGGWSMYHSKGSLGVWKLGNPDQQTNVGNMIRVATDQKHEPLVPVQLSEQLILYPNPASDNVVAKFKTISAGKLIVKITTVEGNEILNQERELVSAGNQSIEFDISELPSGLYLFNAQIHGISYSEKITKL